MNKISNGWLRGFLQSLMVNCLVLIPFITKVESSEFVLIFLSTLAIGTLIFGLINRYYPEESEKQK